MDSKKLNEKFKQIAIIHSLRGLSIIVISFYHFGYNGLIRFDNELLTNLFSFGRKGIHIFFLISGIVIPLSLIKYNYKLNQFWKYLFKRILRIEPPYLIVLVLSVFYYYSRFLFGFNSDDSVLPSLKEIVLHIGYLIPFSKDSEWIVPIFWTLSIEFQYYLFLALLFPLALSKRKKLNWIFNLIVVFLPLTYSGTDLFLHWSAFFGLGIFYVLYINKKYSLIESIILLVLCGFIICIELSFLDFVIGILILGIVHFLPDLKIRIGMFLGEISYSYYLIHTLLGTIILSSLESWLYSDTLRFIGINCTIIIIVLIASFFWKYIEKPSEEKSKGIRLE